MNNLALHPPLEDEFKQTPRESSRFDRLFVPGIVVGRSVANIPPTNDMHPIAIAMPLIVPAAMIAAFWLTVAGIELSLAVTTLTVMMLLGLISACGAFAHKVESNGTRTRTDLSGVPQRRSRR